MDTKRNSLFVVVFCLLVVVIVVVYSSLSFRSEKAMAEAAYPPPETETPTPNGLPPDMNYLEAVLEPKAGQMFGVCQTCEGYQGGLRNLTLEITYTINTIPGHQFTIGYFYDRQPGTNYPRFKAPLSPEYMWDEVRLGSCAIYTGIYGRIRSSHFGDPEFVQPLYLDNETWSFQYCRFLFGVIGKDF